MAPYISNFIQQKLNQILCRFKSCLRRVGDWQWWEFLSMVLAGNKAKCLLLVNHTTKSNHIIIPVKNWHSTHQIISSYCVISLWGFNLTWWLSHGGFKFIQYLLKSVTSRVFLGRPGHPSNPQRCHHGWHPVHKFSKSVPPNSLKMHLLAMPVVKFLFKTFSELLKLTLQKTFSWMNFQKNSYFQIKLVYCYKIVRAVKWSELQK